MTTTYTSKYIIAGRRAGSIKQIINYANCNKIEENLSTPIEPFIITAGSPTIDYSNGYYTITFLDNGGITFLVPLTRANNDFNALVVGGGGGGGKSSPFVGPNDGFGGGGGAGGSVIYNSISVSENLNYNVIIGKGGNPHGQGNSSSFSNIIANGGNVGEDATTNGQGPGGVGINGGGNGGEGGIIFPFRGQNGYNGMLVKIGLNSNYYGGGGGGGSYLLQPIPSAGGLGGGGGAYPNEGKPNTGGGGGGGNGNPFDVQPGGKGGSGIVILYFKYTPTNSTTTTTSSTICKSCVCPSPINSKIVKNSNPDVIPGSTQVERAVNAIKYGRGGKVVYGNAAYQGDGDTLLGRLRGQPLSKFLSMNRF
jgi:hypothetical protein